MCCSKGSRGFTVIELIVVVAMIGVLAAIALPQFASYRARPFDERAHLALKHVAIAEEAYFVDYSVYQNCTESTCAAVFPTLGQIQSGITLQITATASGFIGTATHRQGSGVVYHWPS